MEGPTWELWNIEMVTIRELCESDLGGLGRLHADVFGDSSTSLDFRGLESFYREVFLKSPFCDPSAHSLVAVEDDVLVGFIGVLRRSFQFGGKEIRLGVASRLMVKPSASGLVGASLLRRASRSGLDLFFTDGANQYGGGIMRALGGKDLPLMSLQWFKLFRPMGFASDFLKNRSPLLGSVAGVVSRPMDALLGRFFSPPENSRDLETLGIDELFSLYEGSAKEFPCSPLYSREELDWLVGFCRGAKKRGEFFLKKVPFQDGSFGGFGGYLTNKGCLEVLNFWGPKRHFDSLLRGLFSFARGLGVKAVQGRLSENLFPHLRKEKVIMKYGSWSMAYGKNPGLVQVFEEGKAAVGGLEGELWLPSARYGHD